MAKSKRSKVVPLSKTGKKGRVLKEKTIENIRDAAQKYSHIWLFRVENMRNVLFKQVRLHFPDSKFFLGRTKVMAKALGASQNDEVLEGLHQLSGSLCGDVGLLFSNESPIAVQEFMNSASALDFARTGCEAPETVVIHNDETGLKHFETEQVLPATLDAQLRGCGLPTMLRGGLILLTTDAYTICRAGEKLSSDQCRLLKVLGYRLANFKIILLGHYTEGIFKEMK